MKKFRLLLLLPLLVLFACSEEEKEWYNNQYVFLEYQVSNIENLISGDCPVVMVDYGFCYIYDYNTAIINQNCISPRLDSNTKLVIANRHGMYWGSGLTPVSDFPYQHDQITISNVYEDGSLELHFRDSIIVLNSEEEFKLRETEVTYDIYNNDTLCTWERGQLFRFTNWGILDKENFTQQEWE